MTNTFDINFPKIRNIDATPVTHRGQAFLMLRDPLRLQEESILLPMQLAPLLGMCDGTMGIGELSIALEVSYGIVFTTVEIEDIIGAFNKHLLLETGEFADAEREALGRFREAEVRPAALAGLSYPSDPQELSESLDGYLANVEHHPQISGITGLISPHIDYDRKFGLERLCFKIGVRKFEKIFMPHKTSLLKRALICFDDHYVVGSAHSI